MAYKPRSYRKFVETTEKHRTKIPVSDIKKPFNLSWQLESPRTLNIRIPEEDGKKVKYINFNGRIFTEYKMEEDY